jgi:hypothetical protein
MPFVNEPIEWDNVIVKDNMGSNMHAHKSTKVRLKWIDDIEVDQWLWEQHLTHMPYYCCILGD